MKTRFIASLLAVLLFFITGCEKKSDASEVSWSGAGECYKKQAYEDELPTTTFDRLTSRGVIAEAAAGDIEGNLYIILNGKVSAVAENGLPLSEIELDGYAVDMASDGEGGVCVTAYSPTGLSLFSLDAQTGKAAKLFELGDYAIHEGNEDFFLYFSNQEGLWGLSSPDTEELKPIIIWSECGIDFIDLREVLPWEDGGFLCIDRQGAHLLLPASPDELVLKSTVTLACVSPMQNDEVPRFNLSNDKYSVVVKDYSQGGALELSDAIMKLNTDISTGNIPDMILFSDMPISPYTKHGLMADLYEFLDNDTDVGREDFILLDKFETNGQLFSVSPTVSVEILAGLNSRFGDRHGWSLGEFIELQSSLGENQTVFPEVSREYFLERVIQGFLQDTIDWESGVCDLNNSDFIAILNAAATINPSVVLEFPFELYYLQLSSELPSGDIMISFSILDRACALAEEERLAGQRLSVIGWPTVDSGCGTLLEMVYPIGICAASDNKAGAWEFTKYLLAHELPGLPIYRTKLEASIDSFIKRTPRSLDDPLINEDGFAPLMSPEDAERLFDLLDAIELLDERNEEITAIILDEAKAFFAGDKSAEETAELVQSRVGILLAERS